MQDLAVVRSCKELCLTLMLAGAVVLAMADHPRAQPVQTSSSPQPASPPVEAPSAMPVPPSTSPPAAAPSAQLPQVQTAPSPADTVSSNPGFVEELGKMLRNSASGFSSSLKSSQEAITDFNNRTRDAGDNLTTRLSPQTMVTGRVTCPIAANGAPDCKTASDHLCRAKGYKEGKIIDFESAEKCSAKVYISGRTGAPGECRTENFVTRAMCQ